MAQGSFFDADDYWLTRASHLEADWVAFNGEFLSSIPDIVEMEEEHERDSTRS